MKKLLLILAAALPLAASTVSVNVTGVTPQQAILNIQASDNSACTIQVSENPNFTPVVNDVNETLFPGSSSCNRTGSIVNGNSYRMTVGFRGTATATGSTSDHLIYSRSLQAYTTHYVKVTLASGATATTTFTTQDPPLGNSAPDYIPYNTNGFGNYGWPSQHFSNLLQVDPTIDPLTGFQMNRITGPGMTGNGTSGVDPLYIVNDNSNGGWSSLNCRDSSNSNNIFKSAQSTNYCTYTGPGGESNALFIEFGWKGRDIDLNGGNDGDALPGGILSMATDLHLTLNSLGDNLQACFTLDGSTCIGSSPVTITNQATDTTQTFPSGSFTQVPFLNWNSPVLHADWTLTYSGATTNSGTSVTITDNGQIALMPAWAKPGMWVQMTDNVTYWDYFQIASIADARHFTLQGTIPSGHTYTKYTLQSFGLLVWKAPGGTGTVKIGSMNTVWSMDGSFFSGFEGGGSCNPPITVSNDAAGNPISPIQATNCGMQPRHGTTLSWFWSPTNNEVRVYDLASSPRNTGWNYNTTTGLLSLCVYDNSYRGVPYSSGTSSNSHYSCSIPNTTYTPLQEIKQAHPEIDLNYWTSGGSNNGLVFQGEHDYNGHEYALFVADNRQQNVAFWEFVLDLSLPPGAGQVISAHNSWSVLPWRFATTHYQNGPNVQSDFNGSSHVGVMVSMGGPNSGGVGAHTVMVGQYGMAVNSVANNASGAVASTYAESCSADGVTDPALVAKETSDQSCYQVTVASEPVNRNPPTGSWVGYANGDLTPFSDPSLIGSRPGPWKHNSTSCPGGAGDNTTSNCYSSLVDSAVGDWLVVATVISSPTGDWANDNPGAQYPKNEIDLVAKKTVNGDGTITFVLVRAPKDDFGNNNPNAVMNIPAGFVLVEMIPGNETDGYFPLAQPFTMANFAANAPIFTAHTTSWTTPTNTHIDVSTNDFRQYSRKMGESFAVHQFRRGDMPGVLKSGWTNQSAEYHPFAEFPNPSSGYLLNNPFIGVSAMPQAMTQYHPGGGSWAANSNEASVAFDASPYGTSQGGADTLWTHSYTLVSGQSHTYSITDPNVTGPDGYGVVITSAIDPKRRETYAFAGPFLLQNISGPGSVISDATPFSYCRAFIADECVTGSTVGQSYVSVPDADLDGTCKSNSTMLTPCFTPADPHQSYVYQFSVNGNDPFGQNWRRITMGYDGPTRNANYWNAHGDPTGKYVYVEGDVLDGIRTDLFAVKLPPFPAPDGVRRDTFIQTPVYVPALADSAANTVRIRFGYAEYGLDSNNQPLYCSSERREDCSTGTPPVATDPYAWLSENPTWQDCTKGCTVNIPAISSRVLYYVIDRKVGATVTSSKLQSLAVQ